MRIEWDEPAAPKRSADSLWTKVKNNISIIRQTHDGPPSRSYSSSPSRGSTSRSSSRPPSSSSHHQRSRSSGPSPTYVRTSSGRPLVTIQTNGGPPQVIKGSSSSGQYGSTTTYVVQSPMIYDPYSSSPRFTPASPALGSRPTAVHRSTVPYSSSPLRSPTMSPTPVSPRPGVAKRSSTAPVSASNGGVMYNGKMIVGDPNEVQRYISSQKSIEKWIQNVG